MCYWGGDFRSETIHNGTCCPVVVDFYLSRELEREDIPSALRRPPFFLRCE